MLENVRLVGLYAVNSLVAHYPFSCLLEIRRFKSVGCLRHRGTDHSFHVYDFNENKIFNVPLLHANKRSETGLFYLVNVSVSESP